MTAFPLTQFTFSGEIGKRVENSPQGVMKRGWLASSNADKKFLFATAVKLDAEGYLVEATAADNIYGIIENSVLLPYYSYDTFSDVPLYSDNNTVWLKAGENLSADDIVEYSATANPDDYNEVKKHTGTNTRIGTVKSPAATGELVKVYIKIEKAFL